MVGLMKKKQKHNQIKPIDFFKEKGADFGYITANWLVGFLAENNSDVLIFVDKNGNPIYSTHYRKSSSGKIREYKRINIFNPRNIKIFVENDNCRPKIVKFWDIARKNIQIQICGTNSIYHRDALVDIFRKYYEEYCENPYSSLEEEL